MLQKEKTCQHCNKILHGRSDQRFCNDTCRNTFNRLKRQQEKISDHQNTPEIFRIIKHNYELLKALKPPHEPDSYIWIKDTEYTLKEGFNSKFFTSIYKEPSGSIWYCIFEYGFCMGEKDMQICWLPDQAET